MPKYMESQNKMNGGGGESPGYGPPSRLKELNNLTYPDTGNGKARHGTSQSDLAEGDSELIGKKSYRHNETSQNGNPKNEEDGSETLQEEVILSKAMEEEIQKLRERVDNFTDQGKAHILYASTAFEEGILQVNHKILETLEEELEGLQNVVIVNEEICNRLGEARNVLAKLQVSASSVRHQRGPALAKSS